MGWYAHPVIKVAANKAKPGPRPGTGWTVLDTFSGAGGFSLGFQHAGAEIVGAIESDKWASETFSFNHPDAKVVTRDIEETSNRSLGQLFRDRKPDVLLGGPPCQGFSVCRRDAGDPKDPRNSLFMEFLRVAAFFRPKLCVLENVPGLLKARIKSGEHVVNVIEKELKTLGYHVYHRVLHATDYGVPQLRRRLFVVASKTALECPFPSPTHTLNPDLFSSELEVCPTLWEAISDLPVLAAGEGGEEGPYNGPPEHTYQRLLRQGNSTLFNHSAMRHTPRMVQRFQAMKCGDSVSDVPDELKPRRRNSEEIASTVYDQNNRRMHPNRPCHTIPASFYANFVHPFQDRNFTAREGARIQSFPDAFRFMGKPTVVSHKLLAREGRLAEKYLCQYNQVGNAVPPVLAQRIAENLFRQL